MSAAHEIEHLAHAVRNGDVDRAAELLDPEVTVEIQPEGVQLVGRAAVLAALARWNLAVPDGAIDIVTELSGGSEPVVALTLRGSSVEDRGTQTAAALGWFGMADGRFRRVVLHHSWCGRQPAIAGTALDVVMRTPESAADSEADSGAQSDRTMRSQAWYRDFVDRFAETWSWDPALAMRSICSSGCIAAVAGAPQWTAVGIDAIETRETEALTARGRTTRALRAHDVVGDGPILAARFDVLRPRDPTRRSAGTDLPRAVGSFIARFDEHDRLDALLLFGQAGPAVPQTGSAADS